eukprot:TCONS_00025585-protein
MVLGTLKNEKFCVMEHFNNSPFSVLCTGDKTFIKNHINNLDVATLKDVKSIKSIASYIDKKSKSEQSKLNGNVKYLKDTLCDMMETLTSHEKRFYPLVKCLNVMSSKLPGLPLGKRLRDTYEYCVISPKITKDKRYDDCLALIRLLSRVELEDSLNQCIEILEKAITDVESFDDLSADLETLKNFLPMFQQLDAPQTNEVSSPSTSAICKTPTTPKTPTVFKNRHDFREQLRMAVKEKRKQSPYEKLRNEIIDFLDTIFKKYLSSPMYLPLNEIFYYNDVDTVRMRMNGTPRAAIQTALTDPNYYLQCNCCKEMGSNDIISDCQPDVCVLYKLHTECGKLINLYDWLQAFMTVIDPSLTSDTKKKKSKAKQQKEEQLQARFIRAVSELQFLGFIKSTKRKTDHVARLTWGSC